VLLLCRHCSLSLSHRTHGAGIDKCLALANAQRLYTWGVMAEYMRVQAVCALLEWGKSARLPGEDPSQGLCGASENEEDHSSERHLQ